jgi:hypothetical protein
LAQTFVGPDRERLLEFAADLDREAEVLETEQISISLPPLPEPQPVRQAQVQQHQAGPNFSCGDKD